MFFFIYDCIQLLAIVALLPRFFWSFVFQRKSCSRLAAYMGFSLPNKSEKKGLSFLIYAVSLGETKAAAVLFKQMRALYPNASFYIASRTETGHEEAKRSLKEADRHFYLPLDFSWNNRRLLRRLNPTAVIFIESDLWINFLKEAKKLGALIFLVSGRVSLRSYERFAKLPFFSKKLFGLFDLMCVQNAVFQDRFVSLGAKASKVLVTGNIKFDAEKTFFQFEDEVFLRESLGVKEGDRIVVVGSTHRPEESAILKALIPLWNEFPSLKVLIAPRHPERFSEVAEILLKSSLPFISFSHIQKKTGNEKIVLIDVMGKLSSFYQIADLAITCGSFEERLLGHNILEPILSGTPVLFGPYMKGQQDLVSLVLSFGAGFQVDLKDLRGKVRDLLRVSDELQALREGGSRLVLDMESSSGKTISSLQSTLQSALS